MQGYYGGRAECRIRRTPVPVVLTDFTSQYPTVNALLGNWEVLTAASIRFESCIRIARKLLSEVTLERVFDPAFWKELKFFALVKPDNDILPVRTVYNGRTQNIGLNFLKWEKEIWYAGPDLVASALLRGRPPAIVKAIRLVRQGLQKGLEGTNLGGTVAIDPRTDDFFVRVVEQRGRYKDEKNDAIANFLKVLGNSGSYGLFVQIDPETRKKAKALKIYSGEQIKRVDSPDIEKAGPWYFPPVASLITAGGRLLLAMLEKCVQKLRGSYLFCDTDSLCIVASKYGGLIPCAGGKFRHHGEEAIKALSIDQVKAIVKKFNRLNPYDPCLVPELLKIERINFSETDAKKANPHLWGYSIAAKRYALYERKGNDISIVKASGHGLGYLCAPKQNQRQDEAEDDEDESKEDIPVWVVEAWEWLLRKELGLRSNEPKWLGLPAVMRMAMTSPNVMRSNRPDWLAPFNFFLFPLLSDLGGYPRGSDRSNFKFIVPFESNRARWKNLWGINLWDERAYQIKMVPDGKQRNVVPDSIRIILNQYLKHPEVKSLAPNGSACASYTRGLLRRVMIVGSDLVPIGKETDRRWEQGDDPSLVDFKVQKYKKTAKMAVAEPADRKRWQEIGVRSLMRKSGLSQKAVYAIIEGKPVRKSTLASFQRAMGG